MSKYGTIQFIAKTDAIEPYTVKWQILNTGDEARAADEQQLRGDFYSSEEYEKMFEEKPQNIKEVIWLKPT